MPKGSHSKFFPGKLMLMLDQVDSLGLSHGASWVSEGRAFAIHDPDLFMTEIAPQFFDKQTHLRSFHRQLSIWGFTRLETGAGGRGVWFHKNFVRGNPDLIKSIKRVPVKNPKPTSSNVPKNSLPDYTNYQLPVAVGNQEPAKLAAPAPVGQMTAASLAAANGGLPPAASLPGQLPPEYLAALGRMPPTMAASYPAAAAPGFPPSMLPYYQHPSIAASLAAGGLPPSAGAPAGVGDVAAQLQNLRAQQAAAGQAAAAAPQAGGDANLNAAILSMIMDSRGGAAAAAPGAAAAAAAGLPPGADVRQDLLSAIAKRNNLLAQVSTQEAAATSPKAP